MGNKVVKTGAIYINNSRTPGGVSYIYADQSNDNSFTIGRGTTLGSDAHLVIKEGAITVGRLANLTISDDPSETDGIRDGKITFQVVDYNLIDLLQDVVPNAMSMRQGVYPSAGDPGNYAISYVGIGRNEPAVEVRNLYGVLGIPFNNISVGKTIPGAITFHSNDEEAGSVAGIQGDLYVSAMDDIVFYTGLEEDPSSFDNRNFKLDNEGEVYFYNLSSGAGSNDAKYDLGTGQLTYQVSNRDTKSNIRDLLTGSGVPEKVGVDAINTLRPIVFDSKDGSHTNQLGFIAEEAADAHSTLAVHTQDMEFRENGKVKRDKDGKAIMKSESLKPRMWNKDAVIAHLVGAVQQMDARLSILEPFHVDETPPTASWTSVPDAAIGATSASFSFMANESSVFHGKLNNGGWSTITSPHALTGLTDGSHVFYVRPIDTSDNTGSAITHAFKVDTTPPIVTISGVPDAISDDKTPTFVFSANETSTFEIFLTGWKSWQSSTSPKTLSTLTAGTRTFSVRATDAIGNLGSSSYTWEIDLTSNVLGSFGYPDWTGTIQNPTTSSAFSSPAHTLSGSFAYNSWTGTIQNPATSSNFGTVAHSVNNLFGEKHWSGTISNPTLTSNFSNPSHSISANFNADGKLGW